jgi:hypothetical protein
MASPIEAQLILCDHAVADPAGKVHMLGAGWSVTGTPTSPQAVAILIKVPWDRANQQLTFALRLLDSDGHQVQLAGAQGPVPIANEMTLEVGRPAGVAPGSPLDASMAVNIQPLPLSPGRYEWRLEFDGDSRSASFQVRQV